ncbi:MAG: 30S ribosome-binding factor RbfA [Verrucomicrobiota bacterium]
MSLRLQRVRELLKHEIAEIIRRELPVAEAGLININDVMVSSDLHSALVYVGIFGTAEQKKRGAAMLKVERKRLQGLVGKAVILKYTPRLRFIVDDSIERGNRVLKIIEEFDKTSPLQPAEFDEPNE